MRLQTHGLDLTLAAISRAGPDGWFMLQVTVVVPGFRGDYKCDFELDDLERFRGELAKMSSSVGRPIAARLGCVEPGVELDFAMNRVGQIHGRFELESQRPDGIPTSLVGGFSMDQSFLPSLSATVESLVQAARGERTT